MKRAVGALVALGLVVGLLGTAMVGSAMAMFGIDVQPTATSAAISKIPPAMLALYQDAEEVHPMPSNQDSGPSNRHQGRGRHARFKELADDTYRLFGLLNRQQM